VKCAIGQKFARGLPLKETKAVLFAAILFAAILFAANRARIPLLGELDITLKIDEIFTRINVTATSAINELLLGSDWLSTNNCIWGFGAGTLNINSHVVAVQRMPRIHADRLKTSFGAIPDCWLKLAKLGAATDNDKRPTDIASDRPTPRCQPPARSDAPVQAAGDRERDIAFDRPNTGLHSPPATEEPARTMLRQLAGDTEVGIIWWSEPTDIPLKI
jgi:hypothetical protein